MGVLAQIAEARATAVALRVSAQACGPGQDALKTRLIQGSQALSLLTELALSLLHRAETLERKATQPRNRGGAAITDAPTQVALKTVLEEEREVVGRLMSLATCMSKALLYAEDPLATMYADVAGEIADRLAALNARLERLGSHVADTAVPSDARSRLHTHGR